MQCRRGGRREEGEEGSPGLRSSSPLSFSLTGVGIYDCWRGARISCSSGRARGGGYIFLFVNRVGCEKVDRGRKRPILYMHVRRSRSKRMRESVLSVVCQPKKTRGREERISRKRRNKTKTNNVGTKCDALGVLYQGGRDLGGRVEGHAVSLSGIPPTRPQATPQAVPSPRRGAHIRMLPAAETVCMGCG